MKQWFVFSEVGPCLFFFSVFGANTHTHIYVYTHTLLGKKALWDAAVKKSRHVLCL